MTRKVLRAAALTLVLLAALWLVWQAFGTRPPPPMAPEATRVDHILIEKSARRLTATLDGAVVMTAHIALGFEPAGDKQQQGDGKTPEGRFTIDRRNPNSAYHLSLGLDYPQANDIARARAAGIDPGGDIFIHGQPNILPAGNLPGDWTAGCIALTNSEIERLWTLAPIGTTVEIRP